MSYRLVLLLLIAASAVVAYQDLSNHSYRLGFCPTQCKLPTIIIGEFMYYIHSSSKVSWFEAFEICSVNRMQLLSIESAEKQRTVQRLIATSEENKNFWMSGNDLESEGTWVWRTNGRRVNFTNWAPTEPQNNNGVEHCMGIGFSEASWFDTACSIKMFFICEKHQSNW